MGRGRIATRMERVPASGIRRFFDIAAQMPDVISLGIGEPDFVTPDGIRDAGIRSIADGHTAYTSNSGMAPLRVALAAHLMHHYGVGYDADDELLITVGVSEALQNVMLALIDPGDEVIVPEPCFVAYQACVVFAGGVPVPVATTAADGFAVPLEALEAAITPRTRAIMIGYPNNPTGAVMERAALQQLVDLAARHDLLVISDEIYDRLVYGVTHTCVAALAGARERTVLLGGFSKAYAMTGWRLGWLAAPADIVAATRKIHQYAIMSAPTPAQYAGLAALEDGEAAVQQMVAEYDRRRRVVVNGLNQIGLPTIEPRGAFYAFPRVDHLGLSSEAFAEHLLQAQHVAVIPGDVFGASGAGHVRVCYAAALDKLEAALDRIDRFVRTMR